MAYFLPFFSLIRLRFFEFRDFLSNLTDSRDGTVRFAAATMNHVGIQKNCSTCHNGKRSIGKDKLHIPSNNRCEDCHDTVAFSRGVFDHTGVVSGCFSCHNGKNATGKHAAHIPSPNICEICHNTTAWR